MTAATGADQQGDATPASPEAARQRLREVGQAEVEETRVFLLASRDEDAWPIERLKMTEALADQFVGTLQNFAREHLEDQLVGYSPGRVVINGEAAVLPTDTVPELGELVTTMEGDVDDVPDFDLHGRVGAGLRFYVLSARLANPGWVHGIRVKSIRSLRPMRSRKVAALWTGQLYDELTDDPLVFDDTVDALVVGPQVVVFGQRNFERGLGFLAAAQAEAEAVLRAAYLDSGVHHPERAVV